MCDCNLDVRCFLRKLLLCGLSSCIELIITVEDRHFCCAVQSSLNLDCSCGTACSKNNKLFAFNFHSVHSEVLDETNAVCDIAIKLSITVNEDIAGTYSVSGCFLRIA